MCTLWFIKPDPYDISNNFHKIILVSTAGDNKTQTVLDFES